MMASELSLLLAVSAGLISFLSPCVLPLVPAYVSFITGSSLDELTRARAAGERSPAILRNGLLFVGGFSAVFMAMGASAGFLGSFLVVYSRVFEVVGGILLVGFGILLLEVIRMPWAMREWRVHLQSRPMGNLGTVVAGMAFGFGWTPCVGPILGGILTLAAAGEAPLQGVILLGGYSVGLAVPFLLAALGLSRFLQVQGRIGPWLPWIQRGSGVLLILLGILLATGDFTRIAESLNQMTPEFLYERM
ncbi:MAG: cytochrome c biogenesis protein CcdA [Gemmatimonadales bacterium]|nr:MAG: cytochrome c biogenesis protein CcdA [Gemmatimonadales bacterium]